MPVDPSDDYESENRASTVVVEKVKALENRRREIMSLTPQKVIDQILDAPQPAALVHSFPEQDLYLLIHDIGPEDSLALLALASGQQLQYILDREIWNKDALDLNRLHRWLALMAQADPQRLARWLIVEQRELTEYFLSKTIEVRVLPHEQDPSELGDGFFTLDNVFFLRRKKAAPPAADPLEGPVFIQQLIERLAAIDIDQYHGILLETDAIIPAEFEEQALRLKNVRLAEKGLLPYEQAVGVYQPLTPKQFKDRPAKRYSPLEPSWLPVPLSTQQHIAGAGRLGQCLGRIADEQVLRRLENELTGLCNQVIVADKQAIRSRQQLLPVVKKVCGLINIGLEKLTGKGRTALDQSVTIVQTYPLADIFRVGHGQVRILAHRAKTWRQTAWATAEGFPLHFWGEAWMGLLGGLLLPGPLMYDPTIGSGSFYREFSSLSDITLAARCLQQAKTVDRLLSRLAFDASAPAKIRVLVTWKNLLLTLWARHCLALEPVFKPLSQAHLRTFWRRLWAKGNPRRISPVMKTLLRQWLSDHAERQGTDVDPSLDRVVEDLFAEIEADYQSVGLKDLDPRFITHFLVVED